MPDTKTLKNFSEYPVWTEYDPLDSKYTETVEEEQENSND